jgi:aspartate/methionine/tyrosine aminotransferase
MPSNPYVKLNAGDPDVEAPKYAIEAAQDAIKTGGD